MYDDDIKMVSTSLGGASTIGGVSTITLSYPEQTAQLTSGGTATSANSASNTINSGLGKDTTIMTVLAAFVGGSLLEDPKKIIIESKNNIEYDLIEKRANKVYDKYHKNHIPSSQKGKGIIIAETPDTAVICNEMFNNTFVDEYHLVLNIESLLLAVSGILDSKELVEKEKEQLESTKALLIELKAAYTEKKIITLSTKDNETLSFILNSFKKHQENKKNNAKKLIRKK